MKHVGWYDRMWCTCVYVCTWREKGYVLGWGKQSIVCMLISMTECEYGVRRIILQKLECTCELDAMARPSMAQKHWIYIAEAWMYLRAWHGLLMSDLMCSLHFLHLWEQLHWLKVDQPRSSNGGQRGVQTETSKGTTATREVGQRQQQCSLQTDFKQGTFYIGQHTGGEVVLGFYDTSNITMFGSSSTARWVGSSFGEARLIILFFIFVKMFPHTCIKKTYIVTKYHFKFQPSHGIACNFCGYQGNILWKFPLLLFHIWIFFDRRLARIGSGGLHTNHMHRDIMRTLWGKGVDENSKSWHNQPENIQQKPIS